MNVPGGIATDGYAVDVAGAGNANIGGGTATAYNFTYTDGSGDAANGTIYAVPSGLGGDALWAIGGSMDLTACSTSAYQGNYTDRDGRASARRAGQLPFMVLGRQPDLPQQRRRKLGEQQRHHKSGLHRELRHSL